MLTGGERKGVGAVADKDQAVYPASPNRTRQTTEAVGQDAGNLSSQAIACLRPCWLR